MEGLILIEFINMLASLGTFFMVIWWYASYRNIEDDKKQQEISREQDRIQEAYDIEQNLKKKLWAEFVPPEVDYTLPDIDFNNPQPQRDENGKFNPDEINGILDGFFDDKDTTDGGNFK